MKLMTDGKQRMAAAHAAPRCTATNRAGRRCGAAAISGASVCRVHGGSAPQVKRAAQLRLATLVNPAIGTLAREMTNQSATPGERLRAAENVLDRAGFPRAVTTDAEGARELLLARLAELRAQHEAPDPTAPALDETVIVPSTATE